jgi:uncharacterized protein (TIGR03067 family)
MYPSLLIAVAAAIAAPAAKDAPKKDTGSLVGEWLAEKGVAGGKELPMPEGGVGFNFNADGTMLMWEGKRTPKALRYTADPKKDPPEFDVLPADGKPERGIFVGIYKVEGDRLTVCVATGPQGTARPTKFESPDGSEHRLVVFKRVKKKE